MYVCMYVILFGFHCVDLHVQITPTPLWECVVHARPEYKHTPLFPCTEAAHMTTGGEFCGVSGVASYYGGNISIYSSIDTLTHTYIHAHTEAAVRAC